MLTLARKEAETIEIDLLNGETITVKVIRIHGNRVKVGVDAPLGIRIRRGELQRINNETVHVQSESPVAGVHSKRVPAQSQSTSEASLPMPSEAEGIQHRR